MDITTSLLPEKAKRAFNMPLRGNPAITQCLAHLLSLGSAWFRFLSIAVSILLAPTFTTAQPSWVKDAIKDSATMTVSEDAEALTLLHEEQVVISSDGRSKRNVKIVVKILKRAGREYGTLQIGKFPYRKINGLKGWKISSSGEHERLQKKQIVTIATDMAAGYYDDSKILFASFDDVSAGDVCAFTYKIDEKDWTTFYDRFFVQTQQPVLKVGFQIDIPKTWSAHYALTNPPENIEFTQTGNTYHWQAERLEFIPDENRRPSWSKLSRTISVAVFDSLTSDKTHFSDWAAAGRWANAIMDKEAQPDDSIRELSVTLTVDLETPRQRAKVIGEYVRDKVRYVAIEVGKGRFKPRSAVETAHKLYGDCKDKATLMRSLLASVGISSYSALALLDAKVIEELPTSFQFNHCIVGAPLEQFGSDTVGLTGAISNGWLFFDPTDAGTEFGSIPSGLQNSFVLVADDDNPTLIKLPARNPDSYRRTYRSEATLNDDYSMTAHLRVVNFGGLALNARYNKKGTTQDELIDSWKAFLSDALPTCNVLSMETGSDADSAWSDMTISATGYAIETGGLLLLRPDIIHAQSQPLLSAKERTLPIWFGGPIKIEYHTEWKLPAGWRLDELPPKINIAGKLGTVSASVVGDSASLVSHAEYLRYGAMLPLSEYAEAQEFDAALTASRNMVVILTQDKTE